MNGDGRLLCVVCLKESRDEPGLAVTVVRGDAVCGEHLDVEEER
jgi:hypothetical protein